MNARIQQLITLTALGFSASWLWFFVQQERLFFAVAGALAPLLLLGAVLALEFVLLRWVHGADPTPKATAAQLFRAWWGELKAAIRVFCWRQPFRSQEFPDFMPSDRNKAQPRGVVLVHGYFCNRGLWNPWLARLKAQSTPYIAIDLEPVFGSIDNVVHLLDSAVSSLQSKTGQAPVVVAHSMGGLVLRRWCGQGNNAQRMHRGITLGTPHGGTWLARFALSANAREMFLNSKWLRLLRAAETTAEPKHASKFTCFYSHCDNIVFPASSATMAGANNLHLTAVAHVQMVDEPQPWAELQRFLKAPPEEAKPPEAA